MNSRYPNKHIGVKKQSHCRFCACEIGRGRYRVTCESPKCRGLMIEYQNMLTQERRKKDGYYKWYYYNVTSKDSIKMQIRRERSYKRDTGISREEAGLS